MSEYLEQLKAKVANRSNITTCIRCGKELSDPHSVENGMGPVCNEKHVPEDMFIPEKESKEAAA